MDKSNIPKATPTISYESQHRLASVGIASNIAGFTSRVYFVSEGDEYEVVEKMMNYLQQLSDTCYNRLKHRYKTIFNQLDKK